MSAQIIRSSVIGRFLNEENKAAIGFPVIIMLLVPLRAIVVPRLPFTDEELAILDGPTASPFVSDSPKLCHPDGMLTYISDGRPWNRLEALCRCISCLLHDFSRSRRVKV